MGVVCIQAAILGLFLPETKGEQTLETMSDMEKSHQLDLLMDGDNKARRNDGEDVTHF